MSNSRYVVSLSPHIRYGRTIRGMILTTMIALAPSVIWGVFTFGFNALLYVALGVFGAVGMEFLLNKITRRPISIGDGHAALVGLMVAMLVPAGVPWWVVFDGAVLAILIGKMPYGPLGGAPLSPALVGLLIMVVSCPNEFAKNVYPINAPETRIEGVAPAESPQTAVRIDPSDAGDYRISDLFLGRQVGPIGTVSPMLLLLGGLFLIWRRVSRWRGPAGFIAGMLLSGAVAHAVDPGLYPPVLFQLFTGIAMFGAFFLCTEWTSTPVTPWGLFLFGFMAGLLTIILRLSGLPYGRVPFAIMIMSLATPLFDRITPTPFGKVVRHA
ncbi:MAG: RnfABCDGE type electron transport complex subunit D [Candidatus Eisenbacteria bacterium]|uniref:RnfABCDGE type electron transport complex subunit D n=1 Tax=Eiseniibacteriota bacterium TaxID=2212470 RepID=A0A948RWN3_UNCEI|nr:RnfABCDGE type electron transport complex subunit D [Candidatus Eisenbacteria bacterium]MBU1951266.1 RnfABCDGE type electron transport complex subunit D [Candidatus Eisenbacteria bacterium]MBU2691004.1 RnfABCDGE type electron transport complex subunit D [Candidatus Eisenbacteria bacterium]